MKKKKGKGRYLFIVCLCIFFAIICAGLLLWKKDNLKKREVLESNEDEVLSSLDTVVDLDTEKKEQEEQQKEAEEQEKIEEIPEVHIKTYTNIYAQTNGQILLESEVTDPGYTGKSIELDEYQRDYLERLVFAEAGNEGFEGAALVAQCIRDAMVYKGFKTVPDVRNAMGYTTPSSNTPNEDTLRAVRYIFDDGGMAVKHRVYYFYAFNKVSSEFHESQLFVTQYKNHRFFDSW